MPGSESLALLEVLVHLRDAGMAHHYAMFELQIADGDLLYTDTASLHANWREEPAPSQTAVFGDNWLTSKTSLALGVPSVIVPREWNYILNIDHPAFAGVVARARPLEFDVDNRLF